MKNLKYFLSPLLVFAILAVFGQGGFPTVSPASLPSTAYFVVHQPSGNTTAVLKDSLWNELKFQDESVSLGTPQIKTVNFVGAGVTTTRSGNTATVTIPGATGQGNIQLQDEGSNQGAAGAATTYNVTGKGGGVGVSGNTATFNFPHQFAFNNNGNLASSYFPYGIPVDSFPVWKQYLGSLAMRKHPVNQPQSNDNGLNVHKSFEFVEADDDTLHFDCLAYKRAYMEFEDTDVRFVPPAGYGSNNQATFWTITFRNMSNVDSHFVHFDSTFFVDANHDPLAPLMILAGGEQRTLIFMSEFGSDPSFWQLINDPPPPAPKVVVSIPHTGFNDPVAGGSGLGMFVVPPELSGKQITRVSYRCGTVVVDASIGVSVSLYQGGTETPNLFSATLAADGYYASATGSQALDTADLLIIKTGGGVGTCDGLTATLEIE